MPLDESTLRRLLAAAGALVSDLDPDAVRRELLEAAADVTGARSAVLDEDGGPDPPRGPGVLTVPIAGREGTLLLTEKAGGAPFTDADEQAVTLLAQLAGAMLEHARVYRAADRRSDELERAVRRFEATTAIARAVGGETDLQRVLGLIVERGRTLAGARGVTILLRGTGGLAVAAADGELPPALRAARVRLDDLPADAWLLVPLVFRGQSLGLLAAFEAKQAAEDQPLLQAFAASAATAVAAARTVEEQRLRDSVQAAEAERRRWARELHDETLQALGGLRLLLVGGRRRGDGLDAVVDEAVNRLEEEIGALRSLIRELRPAALDELGPAAAIEGLAERTAARYGITVACDIDLGPARHSQELETTVYRIVQESLTNAVKHAAAQRIDVHVVERDGSVVVEIADDGEGFDPQVRHAGFGLAGMRERVTLLHGDLEIASASSGTRVTAVLPVAA